MNSVNVVLDKHLSTPLNFPNKIRGTSITLAITLAVKALGAQYHCNLKHRIAAALNHDPDTLITKVTRKSDIHDVVSVKLMEVDPNKSDSITTRYRVSAYYIFNVHHHHDGASDTLNAVVW